MNKNELLGYFYVTLVTFIIVNVSVITYQTPNFIDPFNPNLPEFNPPQVNGTEPAPVGDFDLSFLRLFFNILIFLALAIGIYFLFRGARYLHLQWQSQGKKSRSTVSERRKELEDARKRAYEIIDRGLASGIYTSSFVEAYLALDAGLDNYRTLKRPKHVTPKEYSFTVNQPVFQPSVFRIVSVYYNIRYGLLEATRDDLIEFRKELDFLFEEDIPERIRQEWTTQFDQAQKADYTFQIPRKGDQTKPGGGWL